MSLEAHFHGLAWAMHPKKRRPEMPSVSGALLQMVPRGPRPLCS